MSDPTELVCGIAPDVVMADIRAALTLQRTLLRAAGSGARAEALDIVEHELMRQIGDMVGTLAERIYGPDALRERRDKARGR